MKKMRILLRLVVNVAALYVVAYAVPGIRVDSLSSALIASLVLGFVNTFIRPIVKLFALPITLLTFGLFALVINAVLFGLVGWIVPGFHVYSFMAALIGSIVLSIVSWILHKLTHLD